MRARRFRVSDVGLHFLVRNRFVDVVAGPSRRLALFDVLTASVLDMNDDTFAVMDEMMQTYRVNALAVTRVSLPQKKAKLTT